MSALNMAMNGNAYKMIEIKKVNGPVVPMAVPMSNLANLSEPLRPYEPLQNPQTQVTLKPSNPQTQQPRLYQQQVQHPQQHTDLNQASTLSHSASISHNSSYSSPLSTSNGTVQRPVPPPPPSRDGTLSRVEAAPPRGERVGVVADGGRGGGQESTPPPLRPSEETNGVSTVSPQELDFYTKEDEKWWWVCCLEFCFCLL